MSTRTINRIIPAQKVNMGGHLLDQPLPMHGLEQIDPFLLIHHWKSTAPGGQKQSEVGVGPHPHRGFSPVTFIFEGNVQHRDSLGNDAIVHAGGTQWMHAGSGITHSERPGADIAEAGGELEFIQFWVNSPADKKMEAPTYLPLSDEDTPKVTGQGYFIGVVAGEFSGVKGPGPTMSPMTLLRGEAQAGAVMPVALNKDHNTLVYLLDGAATIDGQHVKAKDMVYFNNDGEEFALEAIDTTRFMILSALPLNEELATYGPFVMNTQTEVLQALKDAQMGKMGVLIEEF